MYYGSLEPKPPSVQFSPEWGLRHPEQKKSHWRICDHSTVVQEILERAGKVDLAATDRTVEDLRQSLAEIRGNTISLLVALNTDNDPFLNSRLEQIEKIAPPSSASIKSDFLPSNAWSRDSLAMTQGMQVAPHQAVSAVPLAARTLIMAAKELER